MWLCKMFEGPQLGYCLEHVVSFMLRAPVPPWSLHHPNPTHRSIKSPCESSCSITEIVFYYHCCLFFVFCFFVLCFQFLVESCFFVFLFCYKTGQYNSWICYIYGKVNLPLGGVLNPGKFASPLLMLAMSFGSTITLLSLLESLTNADDSVISRLKDTIRIAVKYIIFLACLMARVHWTVSCLEDRFKF